MSSASDRTAALKYQCLAADKWSRYPATQDVNMGCHSIKNIESETFCDGTYIGPGSSFDISSNTAIAITSADTIRIVDGSDSKVEMENSVVSVTANGGITMNSKAGAFACGDVNSAGNGTAFVIDDSGKTIGFTGDVTSVSAGAGPARWLNVSINGNEYRIPLYPTV